MKMACASTPVHFHAQTTLHTLGVLALFQNEATRVSEWMTHHTVEGVSQFVLLDQESTDNTVQLVRNFAYTTDLWLLRYTKRLNLTNRACTTLATFTA